MSARTIPAPVIDLQPTYDLDEDASDAELLALLVAQGEPMREVRTRAGALLDVAGGAHGLPYLTRTQLELAGLSAQSIAQLRAALRLGRRTASSRPPTSPLDPDSIAAIFHPLMDHLTHEEMYVVMLDARGRYRNRRRVASGGVAACSVFVKDILAPVIETRAAGMVIVHNHPSGSSLPSPEDFALTARMLTASDALGVRLVDHLVISEEGHASAMPGGGRWAARTRPRSL
jgi:DNA repair protein RadC